MPKPRAKGKKPKSMGAHWSTVTTVLGEGGGTAIQEDPAIAGKLDTLKRRWQSDVPEREWSVVTAEREVVYIARYPEGMVLRAGPQGASVTFLTNEMTFGLWQELNRKLSPT